MKNLIVIFLCAIPLVSISQNTQFEIGFNQGYKIGYCYNQSIGCISPLPPISPIPKINESASSYMDGYNRGFLIGKQTYEFNSMIQTGRINLYPNYIEPVAPFRSSDYTKPVDLELLYQVNQYKQKLFDARFNWIEEQFKILSELNYYFFYKNDNRTYNSIDTRIDKLIETLNQKGGVDLTNNNNFDAIAKYLSSVRNSIFNNK